jgi:hypothetical protein
MFCMKTRELGPRPFYMTPHSFERMLASLHGQILKQEQKAVLNVAIVDDAIMSGRTLETILRAVYLAEDRAFRQACEAQGEGHKRPEFRTCIKRIRFYGILNRSGRAKSTFLHCVRSWAGVPFEFRCFVELDSAVHDAADCPLCSEHRRVERIHEEVQTLRVGGARLLGWLNERRDGLKPLMVDSSRFEGAPALRFPDGCYFHLDSAAFTTAEASALAFAEKAERGCSAGRLLVLFDEFTRHAGEHVDHAAVRTFRLFVWRWLFFNWDKVASHVAVQDFFGAFEREVNEREQLAVELLEAAGRACVAGVFPEDQFTRLLDVAFLQLEKVTSECLRDPTPLNMDARERWFCAMSLLWIYLADEGEVAAAAARLRSAFEAKVDSLPDAAGTKGDFHGSMRAALKDLVCFSSRNRSESFFLAALRFASYQLLGSVKGNHPNMIYTHLRELSAEYDVFRGKPDVSLKVLYSIDSLDARCRCLCAAIEEVLGWRLKKNESLAERYAGVERSFKEVVTGLLRLRKSGLNEGGRGEWERIRAAVRTLDRELFSTGGEIHKSVRAQNVRVWDVLEEVEREVLEEGLAERFEIAEKPGRSDPVRDATLFADRDELLNLLKNHTVDVLRESGPGRPLRIVARVSIEQTARGEEVSVFLRNAGTAYEDARGALESGHGLRFERWSLDRYGYTARFHRVAGDPTDELELQFAFLRGHS